MNTISVRDLRNDTGWVLRRVERGETLIVQSNRRPVAQIAPPPERPTWMPTDQFFATALAHRADPQLLRDLAELQPGTIDEL